MTASNQFVVAYETTPSTSLANYGISHIKSTGTDQIIWTITPSTYPGALKWIVCTDANSTGGGAGTTAAAVVLTSGTWDGTNKNAIFTSGSAGLTYLAVAAQSTSRWLIVGYSSGSVTFTNT